MQVSVASPPEAPSSYTMLGLNRARHASDTYSLQMCMELCPCTSSCTCVHAHAHRPLYAHGYTHRQAAVHCLKAQMHMRAHAAVYLRHKGVCSNAQEGTPPCVLSQLLGLGNEFSTKLMSQLIMPCSFRVCKLPARIRNLPNSCLLRMKMRSEPRSLLNLDRVMCG